MTEVAAECFGAGQTLTTRLSECRACLSQNGGLNLSNATDRSMQSSVRPIKEMESRVAIPELGSLRPGTRTAAQPFGSLTHSPTRAGRIRRFN